MLLHIDVSYLTDTQKSYLPLLIELWPGFDITTIEYSSIKIKAECKLEKLPEEIESLRDIINYKNFTVNEVNETVVKIINKKPPEAESILSAIEDNLYFDNCSLKYFSGYLVQKIFLNKLNNESVDNEEKAFSDLLEIAKTIVRPEKSFLHIAADAKKLIEQFGSDLLIFNSLFNESSTPLKENRSNRFQLKQPLEYRRKYFDSQRHVGLHCKK